VGYYAAVATFRLGLDPDNHGIPIVTSSLDLLGAFSLVLAIVILGLH
jgi:mgtE-like transporter